MQAYQKRSLFALLTASSALLPLTGCLENDRSRRDDRVVVQEERVVYSEPAGTPWFDDRRYSGDRFDRDKRDRGDIDKNVPKSAREVAINRGYTYWVANRDCRVIVTDSEHDAVMWSGRVYRGELVEVVPKHNRIFVGRREVGRYERMKDDIRYRVWSVH